MTSSERKRRILAVQARALEFVKAHGEWQGTKEARLLVAQRGAVMIGYTTPFQKLPAPDDKTRYMMALHGNKGNLPYNLNIWFEKKKVLNIEWDDEGGFEALSFKPGEWEQQI